MFAAIDRTSEEALCEQVTAERLEADTEAFADLRRYPGSDDQWEAANYVIETLDATEGVETELLTLEAYTSVPETASLTVNTPLRRVFDDAIPTAFSSNTPDSGVAGELVYVEDTLGDLGDVSGKIVFTRGLPTPATVVPVADAGGAAIVFASPTPGHLHEMIVSPVWGTPAIDDADEIPDVPVVEIQQDAGDWLAECVRGDTVEVTVHAQTTTGVTELPCPVASVEGTESDRYFVVGNHIDGWHEGVTDNATAMASTMALARIFGANPPKRGIIFGFWPGHSMGRYAGSTWYADEHWLQLRENGVAYLHIDLVGLDGADKLWAQHMAEVEAEHLDVLEDGPLPLGSADGGDLLGSSDRPARNSDQSFWGAGLASLLSGARFSPEHEAGGPVGGGWWWHTTEDTPEKADFDLLAAETRLYVAILSRFCNSPVLPHDHRDTVDDVRSSLDEIEAAADGAVDFETVSARLDALRENLDAVASVVDAVDADGPVDRAIEDLQVELGNLLIPAVYMTRPEYEHDLALPHDRLPYLRVAESLPSRSSPRRLFAETTENRWQAEAYDDSHSFVYEYGSDVVDLLAPDADERIMDLGCGTGLLAAQIADHGATVVGVDNAPGMIAAARENYPDLTFHLADATALPVDEPFDAVFSNAALHWIDDQDAALSSVADSLVTGGRFVAELGGQGNVRSVLEAVEAEFDARGHELHVPWYFPSLGEYMTRIESHGFEPRYAVLFDRPTELDGEGGIRNWLAMFGDSLLAPLPPAERGDVVTALEERLRPLLYRDGTWVADYRRLRFSAVHR